MPNDVIATLKKLILEGKEEEALGRCQELTGLKLTEATAEIDRLKVSVRVGLMTIIGEETAKLSAASEKKPTG